MSDSTRSSRTPPGSGASVEDWIQVQVDAAPPWSMAKWRRVNATLARLRAPSDSSDHSPTRVVQAPDNG